MTLRFLALVVLLAGSMMAVESASNASLVIAERIAKLKASIDEARAVLIALGERIPEGTHAAVDAARARLAKAEAPTATDANPNREALIAATARRDAAIDGLFAHWAPYQNLL